MRQGERLGERLDEMVGEISGGQTPVDGGRERCSR